MSSVVDRAAGEPLLLSCAWGAKPGAGLTDIFFSYSSKDRDRVEAAHKALTERGFDVFWDLQVPAGIDWDRWIHARLDQSRCVIVFWTANSAASDNVRHEVAIARKQGKLFQVLLDPLDEHDLPMGTLADQAVKLMNWRGNATDPEWAKLIVAVEEKATPRWLRQKVHGLEIALIGERHRVAEADTKARTLEEAHAREVAAQGDLRRERDKLKDERDRLKDELGSLTAKTDGQLGERKELQAERDRLAASTKELTKERDALKAERDRFVKERGSAAKEPKPATDTKKWDLLFLLLGGLCSALAYLPELIEVTLLNWKFIDHRFEFVDLIRVSALIACLLCFAGAVSLHSDRRDALLVGGIFMGAPIAVAWTVLYFSPFAGWWQVVYLIPVVLGLGQLILAYVVSSDI